MCIYKLFGSSGGENRERTKSLEKTHFAKGDMFALIHCVRNGLSSYNCFLYVIIYI